MPEIETIFDNVKWRVRQERFFPPYPVVPVDIEPGKFTRVSASMFHMGGTGHDHGDHPADFTPLEHADEFYVNTRDGKPVVDFTDSTSSVLKTIWQEAENVFYDEHFYALRGLLRYSPPGGGILPAKTHFLIWYQGLDGVGRRTLGIALLHDSKKFEPTRELIASMNNPWTSARHGGGWHADDTSI